MFYTWWVSFHATPLSFVRIKNPHPCRTVRLSTPRLKSTRLKAAQVEKHSCRPMYSHMLVNLDSAGLIICPGLLKALLNSQEGSVAVTFKFSLRVYLLCITMLSIFMSPSCWLMCQPSSLISLPKFCRIVSPCNTFARVERTFPVSFSRQRHLRMP